jgi:hypothetical protein
MKAELLADGTLAVTPETPTEAYALKCWHNEKGALCCHWDAPLSSKTRARFYNPAQVAECGGPCFTQGPEACNCGALWGAASINSNPSPCVP